MSPFTSFLSTHAPPCSSGCLLKDYTCTILLQVFTKKIDSRLLSLLVVALKWSKYNQIVLNNGIGSKYHSYIG